MYVSGSKQVFKCYKKKNLTYVGSCIFIYREMSLYTLYTLRDSASISSIINYYHK